MKKILNLTQHVATQEQILWGVVEPRQEAKPWIKELLTFQEIPSMEVIEDRAASLAYIAAEHGIERAMIGGAPYLMAPLEKHLKKAGMQPCYAFSKRVVKEEQQEDGSIRKTTVFRHCGFIYC